MKNKYLSLELEEINEEIDRLQILSEDMSLSIWKRVNALTALSKACEARLKKLDIDADAVGDE